MWNKCQRYLQDELPPTEFSTWIRPLKVTFDDKKLNLKAPNRFVLDWVREKYLPKIQAFLVKENSSDFEIFLDIISNNPGYQKETSHAASVTEENAVNKKKYTNNRPPQDELSSSHKKGNLNKTQINWL